MSRFSTTISPVPSDTFTSRLTRSIEISPEPSLILTLPVTSPTLTCPDPSLTTKLPCMPRTMTSPEPSLILASPEASSILMFPEPSDMRRGPTPRSSMDPEPWETTNARDFGTSISKSRAARFGHDPGDDDELASTFALTKILSARRSALT